VLIVLAAMARQMFLYVNDDAVGGDSTMMLGIATAPFWYVVAAMLACATVAQGVVAVLEIAGRSTPHAGEP
jgi:hypothetical protein